MPKPTNLLTDWMTIGTAGPTVDGRTIKDSWLDEMAEIYDPDEYTAVINYEHIFGNLGSVRELRTDKDKKGRKVLQARIRPNWDYMMTNASARKLFTSMEIAHNYAETGKCYLTGLASTDKPASLGTTEIHFSAEDGKEEGYSRSEPMEIDFSFLRDGSEPENGDSKGLFSALKSLFEKHLPQTKKEDDPDMTPEELKKAIEEGNKPLQTELSTLKTKVEELETKFSAKPPAGDDDPDKKDGKTDLKKKDGKDKKDGYDTEGDPDEFSELKQTVDGLKGSIDTLSENLSKALEGKTSLQTGDDKGPAGGEDDKEFV